MLFKSKQGKEIRRNIAKLGGASIDDDAIAPKRGKTSKIKIRES